jgi:tRNA(Ile)-lysidine synthase
MLGADQLLQLWDFSILGQPAWYPADEMLHRVTEFIARHRLFETGQSVGVAVSGGADSVFLLHALHQLASHWNLKLSVVHIEHGIRGAASLQDAEFVRELAASFALPFHLYCANVCAMADNLEQAARNVRHGFYRELLAAGTLDRIATGHTHNDQAETVLYRILRGSGFAGIAGILPVTQEGLVRPLLEIQRVEIEKWLRERRIDWREDETNKDLSYARNRLRYEILPLLRENFNPRLDRVLAHLATLAQDEENYWNTELARYRLSPPDAPVVSTSELTDRSPAMARRLVRYVIEHVKGDLRQIDFSHVQSICDLARSPKGHQRVQIPGVDVLRSFEWLRFAPAGRTVGTKHGFSLTLAIPGSGELPNSPARITVQIIEKAESAEAYDTVVDDLDWQRVTVMNGIPSSLELRNWRPGDQYRRIGQSKPEKIKVLFQEARVPFWERHKWPIITYNGIILWARRFGAAAEFAADPDSRVILRVGETVSSYSNQADRF